jgi:ubiquinone/menaquinone biosynthesis C-methylase UbiE
VIELEMQPGEEFKLKDASSYNAVADSFDRFTRIVTTPLAETMVRLAGLRHRNRVLDVGTGSGIVAHAATAAIPGLSVTGIDLSDGLLSLAQSAVRSSGPAAAATRFVKSDAETLPFSNGSFDTVLSLFALLHFPHPDRALSEMYRVLRPGGKLVVGIGSGPPWSTPAGWTHRIGQIVDRLRIHTHKLLIAPLQLNQLADAHLAAGDEEETDLARHHGSRPGRAVRLVRNAGFGGIATSWQSHRLKLVSPGDFWELQSTFSSFVRKRIERGSPEQVDALRMLFDQQCRRVLANGGDMVYRYAALFIVGTKPL